MQIRKALLAIAMIGGVVQTANAAPEGMRLIETAPGVARWMSSKEVRELAKSQHEEGRCGGFIDLTQTPDLKPRQRTRNFTLIDRNPKQNQTVEAMLPHLSAQGLEDTVLQLSNFENRYYDSKKGVESAHWIRDQFLKFSAHRNDVEVELITHKDFIQPSVVARIKGSGSRASEIVVLGGHEDSVNWRDESEPMIAPGADDNASGISTLLETFRVLMLLNYQPERTIEFMTYAGEELGLLGSADISTRYRKARKNVVGVIQFDMTQKPGNAGSIQILTDFVDPDLTIFLKKLIDTYVKVPWQDMKCNYACSDHASWTRNGYAAVTPFEAPWNEMNRKIHTREDTRNLLNMDFGLHFAKIGVAFAVELGTESVQ